MSKSIYRRNNTIKCVFLGLLLFCVFQSEGQKRGKNKGDFMQELDLVRGWYKQLPFSMDMSISRVIFPGEDGLDSTAAKVEMACGQHTFYLKQGEIEQLINDSLQVIINHDARVIHIFPVDTSRANSAIISFNQGPFADTAIRSLQTQYDISVSGDSSGFRVFKLISKAKVANTNYNREEIYLTFQSKDYQPVTNLQIKHVLVPLDQSEFTILSGENEFKDKLVSLQGENGLVYFLIKEEKLTCLVNKVTRHQSVFSLEVKDVISRQPDGSYSQVKKYNDYSISVEN